MEHYQNIFLICHDANIPVFCKNNIVVKVYFNLSICAFIKRVHKTNTI